MEPDSRDADRRPKVGSTNNGNKDRCTTLCEPLIRGMVAVRPTVERLQLKPMKGLKIHHTQSSNTLNTSTVGCHTKIRTDQSGQLHISKKSYKVSDAVAGPDPATLLPRPSFLDPPLALTSNIDDPTDHMDIQVDDFDDSHRRPISVSSSVIG